MAAALFTNDIYMSDNNIIRIGITQGDINGIGPEVIIKTFADPRMAEMCVPVIYGSSKVFSYYKKNITETEAFSVQVVGNAREARIKRINLIETGAAEVKVEPGVASPESGSEAVAALRRAADDLAAGEIDVIVTAPINKESVQQSGFGFTGHTEFFADRFGGEPLMVMCSEMMKVGLVTIHVPVASVAGLLSKETIVRRLKQMREMLISDFRIVEPRIAVLGLNPHAGDGGVIGTEEIEIIKPAITEALAQGVLAFGPFAADGFFASAGYKKYDAVLAMYHDQGLAPFKSLSASGVNFTASLPVVRTSPDHGVAYDIAGQGVADEASMRDAVYAAMDIFRNRRWYAEISANPLKRYERERGADISVRDMKLPEE